MQKKRGNSLGFLIFDIYLSLGVKHAYALLYFVAIYYLIFDRSAVKTSLKYVNARFPSSNRVAKIWHIYKLIVDTGKNLIDLRLLERSPEKIKFECNNKPIEELIAKNKGLIMLTSHIGNWQIMMRKLPSFGTKNNIVMLPEENIAVKEFLKIDNEEFNKSVMEKTDNTPSENHLQIINPANGIESVIEMLKELSDGHIVSIMGDRLPIDNQTTSDNTQTATKEQQTLKVNFFGEEKLLPKGPFLIANASKAPIMILLLRRVAPASYSLETTSISIDKTIKDKENKILSIAEKYSKIIEKFLKQSPYQWNATSMK